jgi:DNA transposition AAA+ family ATPase
MNDVIPAPFLETQEYRRFVEFCDTYCRYRYIGLCYGAPGVGKTVSAGRDARWGLVNAYRPYPRSSAADLAKVLDCHAVFYTPAVMNTPGQIEHEIRQQRQRLHQIRLDEGREEEAAQLEAIRQADREWSYRLMFEVDWFSEEARGQAAASRPDDLPLLQQFNRKRCAVRDPTDLLAVDEVDRLKLAGLEQLRSIYDRGDIGLVLLGMPGLEKRLSRYPQLYSRVGFVHAFRPLGEAEVRRLLKEEWRPFGVLLPEGGVREEEAIAAIIRITGGNFRLLHRLLTQVERLMEINRLGAVTRSVVEAARESLVIGTS